MALPPGAISPAATRVLFAVMAQERPTVRSVMKALDLSSSSITHRHLRALKKAGLVDWEPGNRGTLRATVGVPGWHEP